MEEELYRKGLLRDVYLYNFLTEPQLSRFVAGGTLQQWIQQDTSRGQFAAFHGNVWLWSVDGLAIPELREILRREGVIFTAD